jgi:type I restriction enzyme S subunit
MEPYEKYRPSGVDWIGDIPNDWELTKLRYLSDIDTGEKNTEDRIEDGLYPFFVRSQTVERINSFSFDGEAILTAGDGVGVAKVFHYYNGKFDFHQRVYKMSHFKNIVGRYLFYYLQANLYKEVLKWNAKSTVDSLRLPMFQSFLISYPKELNDQTMIAKFLDKKTTQIDKLISNKQKLIELLKEERTAIINEAVSGKEKRWENRRLSTLGRFFKGSGIKKDETKNAGLPCIRYGEIYTKYDRIVYETVSFIDEETSKSSEPIKKGDVLFAGSGETVEDIGKAIVYFGDSIAFAGGDVIVLRLQDSLEPTYASYLMNASFVQHQKALSGKGEIIVHIYPKNIREITIPLPPREEQLQLVRYLDKRTNEIDSTIFKIEKEIGLTNEYRTALISEVVTGKIKVI